MMFDTGQGRTTWLPLTIHLHRKATTWREVESGWRDLSVVKGNRRNVELEMQSTSLPLAVLLTYAVSLLHSAYRSANNDAFVPDCIGRFAIPK